MISISTESAYLVRNGSPALLKPSLQFVRARPHQIFAVNEEANWAMRIEMAGFESAEDGSSGREAHIVDNKRRGSIALVLISAMLNIALWIIFVRIWLPVDWIIIGILVCVVGPSSIIGLCMLSMSDRDIVKSPSGPISE